MANILDLDPLAFAATLEELQLPEGDAARLREQYRQRQSPFAGVKEALQPEEGRNTSGFLPVSVPEGMSIAEGITSGNWDWAVPEGLSGGATAALEGIEAPGQIASGVPFSQQELQDAAWKTAGAGAAGSLTAPVPEGATRMFGGLRARKSNLSGYQTARSKLNSGEDPNKVWKETGWARNKNGQLRFEIADDEFQYTSPPDRQYYYLEDVAYHPDLFENYPELRYVRVSEQLLEDDHFGYMDFDSNNEPFIVINSNQPKEVKLDTVLHELQHIVQSIEDPNFENRYAQNSVAYGYFDQPEEREAELPAKRLKIDRKDRPKITPEFNSGGMVQEIPMEQDMTKLFAEGGINTGDVEVDPVSGNEVPPGSLPEEVRDDVDAKLSGGEYVVPADVLRYYGVSFFEKLRKKAKEGLAEMDAEGRIGGDEAPAEGMTAGPEEDDDLPFGEDELLFEEGEDEMGFAAGGVVPGQAAFNPNQFYAGFSAFGDAPQQQIENRTYVNAQGQRMSIQFINGQPQQAIPAGFYPEGQLPASSVNPLQPSASTGGQNERPNADPQRSKTRENTEQGFDWAKGKDFKNMSATEAAALANSRLESGKVGQGIAQGVGALLGPAGSLLGGAMNMRPAAEVNGIERHLRSIGNTEAADAVAAIGDKYVSERGIGLRALENVIAPGAQVAKTLAAMQGQGSATNSVGTFTKSANPTVRGENKDETRGRDSGSRMTTSADGKSVTITKGPGPAKPVPSKPAPAPSRPAPTKPTPSKPSKSGSTARAKGGLIQRRKK